MVKVQSVEQIFVNIIAIKVQKRCFMIICTMYCYAIFYFLLTVMRVCLQHANILSFEEFSFVQSLRKLTNIFSYWRLRATCSCAFAS